MKCQVEKLHKGKVCRMEQGAFTPSVRVFRSHICVQQHRSSLKPFLWVFMETTLHGHHWWNHWPLVIISIFNFSPCSEVLGWGWMFQPPKHLAGSWQPAPIQGLSKTDLININSGVFERLVMNNKRQFYGSHHKKLKGF